MIATMVNGREQTDFQIEARKNIDPIDISGQLAKLNGAMAFTMKESMCLDSLETSSSARLVMAR